MLLRQVILRYQDEVTQRKRGTDTERGRIRSLLTDPLLINEPSAKSLRGYLRLAETSAKEGRACTMSTPIQFVAFSPI